MTKKNGLIRLKIDYDNINIIDHPFNDFPSFEKAIKEVKKKIK